MRLFSKEEINVKRQFEFDLAKAICILGMVFVHCFEEFPLTNAGYNSSIYYVFIGILNTIFGAGTFMICLGIGLSFTKNNKPDDFIKRGIITFLLGYLLNVFRFVIPYTVTLFYWDLETSLRYLLSCLLEPDIMQFAGLAFLLFGLLKKMKVSDWGLALIALYMSFVGSLFRFVTVENIYLGQFLALFYGTEGETTLYHFVAVFPLFNWFIIVLFGYFFGKLIKHTENIELFYAISTPISAVVIALYLIIAIPNGYGMMGNVTCYYQVSMWEVPIIMMGSVLAFGLYHYISKLFNDKVKKFVTGLSVNINKTYCIHWVIIGVLLIILWAIYEEEGIPNFVILILAVIIYVISSLLAELYRRKKAKKYGQKHRNI